MSVNNVPQKIHNHSKFCRIIKKYYLKSSLKTFLEGLDSFRPVQVKLLTFKYNWHRVRIFVTFFWSVSPGHMSVLEAALVSTEKLANPGVNPILTSSFSWGAGSVGYWTDWSVWWHCLVFMRSPLAQLLPLVPLPLHLSHHNAALFFSLFSLFLFCSQNAT